ncbi:hypothetical protein PPYR_05657 [Photinus pyralis]|uniref:Nematode cuticle collagen N-terminal domain-containing protein n=1 Tax=Photinus pyralis TaxID=7054 RepID=A0A5N4AVL8_PHOPY|nr:hypothetical protein PPYR_05657 [Photinus pyralis]
MAIVRVLTFIFLFWAVVVTEEMNNINNKIEDSISPNQVLQVPRHPITWNTYNVIATTTAVVVVAAGVTALMALILPLIAYKICYFIGDCEDSFFTHVDKFIASEVSSRKNLEKRSLEYVGPILQALSSAYEKYESLQTKKKPEMSTFYRR